MGMLGRKNTEVAKLLRHENSNEHGQNERNIVTTVGYLTWHVL